MKFINKALLAAAVLAPFAAHAFPDVVTSGAKNVILVPGAFADGATWRQIHDQLWLKGYKITVVQQPQTTLDDNVAATRAAIDAQDGPVVLVGHDSGGAVVSIAGASDKVKALVYLAALQPEVGESVSQLLASKPLVSDEVKASRDGHLSLDPAKFRDVYAQDVPPNRTNFLSVAQTPITRATVDAPVWSAAWHAKPSYAIVASEDRLLNPELQRWMYKRAGSQVIEIKASHALHISQPEEVAKFIIKAALEVK
jgi:pimeloyl-ACP methyl ester carboxylesterase